MTGSPPTRLCCCGELSTLAQKVIYDIVSLLLQNPCGGLGGDVTILTFRVTDGYM